MVVNPLIREFNGCADAVKLEGVVSRYLDALPAAMPEFDLDRPTFILAPCSLHGVERYPFVRPHLGNIIAEVDDYHKGMSAGGVPYITTEEFKRRIKDYANPLAINFANTLYSKRFFEVMCAQNDIECIDFVPILAQVNGQAVYVSPQLMRQSVINRSGEYFEVLHTLQDDASKCALLSTMMYKLTYDRNATLHYLYSLENEYFNLLPITREQTFSLGDKESFIDVGAHHGQSVRRFLTAVDFQFESLHSFEPDRGNFSVLKQLHSEWNLPNFYIHAEALSDVRGVQSFHETNAMGSHIADHAPNIEVQTVRLDDVVDHATFIKMNTEGHENKVLQGATRILKAHKPRLAIAACHYPHDLLDVFQTLRNLDIGYEFRFKQHTNYYYDEIIYVSPSGGW